MARVVGKEANISGVVGKDANVEGMGRKDANNASVLCSGKQPEPLGSFLPFVTSFVSQGPRGNKRDSTGWNPKHSKEKVDSCQECLPPLSMSEPSWDRNPGRSLGVQIMPKRGGEEKQVNKDASGMVHL